MYILECQLSFDLTSSRKDCHDFFPVPTWSKIFIFDFAASENNWKAGSGACFGRLILQQQYKNLDENMVLDFCVARRTLQRKKPFKKSRDMLVYRPAKFSFSHANRCDLFRRQPPDRVDCKLGAEKTETCGMHFIRRSLAVEIAVPN